MQKSNQSITQYLQSPAVEKNIESVLGERKYQFITSVTSLVGSNEALQSVDRKSLFNACLKAAALNLPIDSNLGFAYVIPYKGQAQFQMGYKGFIQLAQRSDQFKTLNVSDVREGEYQGINRLTGEVNITWIDTDRESLKAVGYIAYMRLINGFEKSLYMTVEELNKHGMRFSQTMKKGYGLWKEDFDAMAKKTVIKLLLSKYAPMTTEMQTAQLADQAVITEKGYHYSDNTPMIPEEVSAEKERARIITHIEESKTVEELDKCRDFIPDDEVRDMYEAKLTLLLREEAKK